MTSYEPVFLSGAVNFRDFGGFRTSDGGKIKRGLLYRSNSLTKVHPDDIAILKTLNIRTIADLRTKAECVAHPSAWDGGGATIIVSPKQDTRSMLSAFLGRVGEDVDWLALFSQFCCRIPDDYAQEYTDTLRALAHGRAPLLINCSAGKDRTGVAVALILLLGPVGPKLRFWPG